MIPASTSIFGAWALWTALGLGGVAFFLLLFWLRGDPARGRLRCRRCWYDMRGAPSLTCPECGRVHRSERALLRTRRRPWQVTACILLVASSLALSGVWLFSDLKRLHLLPTWALVDLVRARRVVGWTVASEAADGIAYGRDPRRVTVRQLASIVDAWIDAAALPAPTGVWNDYTVFAPMLEYNFSAWYGHVSCTPEETENGRLLGSELLGRDAPWLAPRLEAFMRDRRRAGASNWRDQVAAEMLAGMSTFSDDAAARLIGMIIDGGESGGYAAHGARTRGGPHLLPMVASRLNQANGNAESALWNLIEHWTEPLKQDPAALARWYTPEVRLSLARGGAEGDFTQQALTLFEELPPPQSELPALVPALIRAGTRKGEVSAFTAADQRIRERMKQASPALVEAVVRDMADPAATVRFRAADLLHAWTKRPGEASPSLLTAVLVALVTGLTDEQSNVSWPCQQACEELLKREHVRATLSEPHIAREVADAVVLAIARADDRNYNTPIRLLAEVGSTLGDHRAPVRSAFARLAESGSARIRAEAQHAVRRMDSDR